IFSELRCRSTPPYVIDCSIYPGGRRPASPTRYSPGGIWNRKDPSICGLIVRDWPTPPRCAGVGAPPAAVSGRVKEEGAGAPPSTERRPVTITLGAGALACSKRKAVNTTEVIPPSGHAGKFALHIVKSSLVFNFFQNADGCQGVVVEVHLNMSSISAGTPSSGFSQPTSKYFSQFWAHGLP